METYVYQPGIAEDTGSRNPGDAGGQWKSLQGETGRLPEEKPETGH